MGITVWVHVHASVLPLWDCKGLKNIGFALAVVYR